MKPGTIAGAIAVLALASCRTEPAPAPGPPGPAPSGRADPSVPDVKDPALRAEILEMARVDQEVRKALFIGKSADPALPGKLRELDRRNTARLREIVGKGGWPGRSLVGEDGASAAWLLVQHADADPDFQEMCLAHMQVAAARGEASPRDVAYLTDRVLLARGKRQVYGTQFVERDGRFVARPIEDEAGVDARRAEVGLPPLEEYRRRLEEVYGTAGGAARPSGAAGGAIPAPPAASAPGRKEP